MLMILGRWWAGWPLGTVNRMATVWYDPERLLQIDSEEITWAMAHHKE
jgi:hypothetical protein